MCDIAVDDDNAMHDGFFLNDFLSAQEIHYGMLQMVKRSFIALCLVRWRVEGSDHCVCLSARVMESAG